MAETTAIELIADRHSVSVMPREEFDAVYDRGFRFPGFLCQACRAWHPWEGNGPSPCLTETLLRRRPPDAKSALAQAAVNADWYRARHNAALEDGTRLYRAAEKAGFWEAANEIRLASYKKSAALEARMEQCIKKAAALLVASVTRSGVDFRTARPYWIGHVLGEGWCLWPKPGDAYRTEQLRELLTARTGCSPETAGRIAGETLHILVAQEKAMWQAMAK